MNEPNPLTDSQLDALVDQFLQELPPPALPPGFIQRTMSRLPRRNDQIVFSLHPIDWLAPLFMMVIAMVIIFLNQADLTALSVAMPEGLPWSEPLTGTWRSFILVAILIESALLTVVVWQLVED